MPRNPRSRRRRSRGQLPPRPPLSTRAGRVSVGNNPIPSESDLEGSRPERLVERSAPYLAGEMIRVAYVSAVCLTLLAALVVADRLG